MERSKPRVNKPSEGKFASNVDRVFFPAFVANTLGQTAINYPRIGLPLIVLLAHATLYNFLSKVNAKEVKNNV